MLKTSIALNIYKVFLWLITVISAFFAGKLWNRNKQDKSVIAAYVNRAETNAEVESKSDEAVRKELSKWVRK